MMREVKFEEVADLVKKARQEGIENPHIHVIQAVEAIVKKIEELEKDIQVLSNEIRLMKITLM